jgi:hypothetical protein
MGCLSPLFQIETPNLYPISGRVFIVLWVPSFLLVLIFTLRLMVSWGELSKPWKTCCLLVFCLGRVDGRIIFVISQKNVDQKLIFDAWIWERVVGRWMQRQKSSRASVLFSHKTLGGHPFSLHPPSLGRHPQPFFPLVGRPLSFDGSRPPFLPPP